jgi:hypothetical protein
MFFFVRAYGKKRINDWVRHPSLPTKNWTMCLVFGGKCEGQKKKMLECQSPTREVSGHLEL